MRLSGEERRALGIILGLLIIAAAARWIERPRSVLEDVPALDVVALEEASRAAKPGPRPTPGGAGSARPVAGTAAGVAAGAGGAAGGAASGAAVADGRIDPNTATLAELQRLPGVGPATAQRIVEERERGRYATAADLQRVRGIGPALAARLAEHVALPEAAAARPGGGPPAPRQTPVATPAVPPGSGAGLAPGQRVGQGAGQAAGQGSYQPLDLNRAAAAELQAVPGIGPALAGRLIARRDSLGGFRDWAQVDAVRGIGPAVLARLQERTVIRP